MKKIIILSGLGLLVIIFGFFMLWPRSFNNMITDDVFEMQITVIEMVLSNDRAGESEHNVETYMIVPGSDEFVRMQQIFDRYSYRRSFRTFFNGTSIDGRGGIGYAMLIDIYGTDYKGLSSMGTGEMAIIDRVYRIGYWGNARNIAMMAEIRSVLASINPKVSDGSRFAAEYMEHNGQLRSNGEPHFVLDISGNNPVIYLEAHEVINKLESGTGIINLGFPICPWCREIIPHLIELAEQNNMPLYYMNIQSIRDVRELDESGEVITTTEGTPEYHRMIEILYDWLWEYAGLESPEIKRIYVPTTIFVRDGEIIYVHIATLRENYEGGYKPLDDPQLERVKSYLNSAMTQIFNNTDNSVDDDCIECP